MSVLRSSDPKVGKEREARRGQQIPYFSFQDGGGAGIPPEGSFGKAKKIYSTIGSGPQFICCQPWEVGGPLSLQDDQCPAR